MHLDVRHQVTTPCCHCSVCVSQHASMPLSESILFALCVIKTITYTSLQRFYVLRWVFCLCFTLLACTSEGCYSRSQTVIVNYWRTVTQHQWCMASQLIAVGHSPGWNLSLQAKSSAHAATFSSSSSCKLHWELKRSCSRKTQSNKSVHMIGSKHDL